MAANSTSRVSRSSCASCASVRNSSCSWYFLRRSASSARGLSPRASSVLAASVSRSVRAPIRRWYWCSLSRWFLRSRIALFVFPAGRASSAHQGGPTGF
ncbi:hypothetical protein DL764_007872 [Monosporascus ibericus]|uniref:Uncharacterized protein n=1 Tax=Monosporascus ibericus TaxID=155417 RepID=A0A4Q4T2C3_9PEZI|nr:hypothetical protein DL764_007872 [Monosporascus ibericus]